MRLHGEVESVASVSCRVYVFCSFFVPGVVAGGGFYSRFKEVVVGAGSVARTRVVKTKGVVRF